MRHLLTRCMHSPATLVLAAALLIAPASAAHAAPSRANTTSPVTVTVFAPHPGDITGVAGKGFIVDLALTAAPGHDADLVGSPRFIAPTDPSFVPGPNPAIPGLVVTLSSSAKHVNLANLFQLTGVAHVGGAKQVWSTWLIGKPKFGVGIDSTLTVYVMKGLAPTLVPATPPSRTLLSGVTTVRFHIDGPAGQGAAPMPAQPTPTPAQ